MIKRLGSRTPTRPGTMDQLSLLLPEGFEAGIGNDSCWPRRWDGAKGRPWLLETRIIRIMDNYIFSPAGLLICLHGFCKEHALRAVSASLDL